MKVLWVTNSAPGGWVYDPTSYCSSTSASLRLRVATPAKHLQQRGWDCQAVSHPGDAELARALDWKPDVAVFSKVFEANGPKDVRDLVCRAGSVLRRHNVPVAADIADNYFADSRGEDVTALLRECTIAIANTPGMADEVRSHADIPAIVIGDPVEGALQEPRFAPPDGPGIWRRIAGGLGVVRPLNLLWFGGQERNYAYLRAWFPGLAELSRSVPIKLTVVFAEVPDVVEDLARLNSDTTPGMTARLVPWSTSSLQSELAGADIVLLPSIASDLTRIGASATRLSESIWAGRFVVANGLASYWEFKESAWIGDDILAGIRWALANPESAKRRIVTGQQIIARRYAPEVIGELWNTVLHDAASRAMRAPNEQ